MADRPPQSMIEALQSAVVTRLKAAVPVKALVKANVFDEVPSDKDRPPAPYLYLGPVNRRRIAELGSCSNAFLVTFRLYAVSTEFGRREAWAVIDAATHELDNKEISLALPYSTIGDVVKLITDGDVVAPLTPKSTFADFTVTLTQAGD